MDKSMNSNDLLAKSDGTTLIAHSRAVADMAKRIAETLGFDSVLTELCYVAGLLHDIGKAISPFQEILRENEHGHGKLNDDCNARHSAVSGWFMANHAATFDKMVPGVNGRASEILCRAVTWHHKPYFPVEESRFAYDEQFDAEIKSFVDALVDTLDWSISSDDDFDFSGGDFSYFYTRNLSGKINSRIHAVRSVVIRADYLVSGGFSEYSISKLAPIDIDSIACPIDFNAERFLFQRNEIAKKAVESGKKTVVINAPAGFGKTIIGLLAGLHRGEKIYWVVPRNVIAEEVYRSISDLLSMLNISEIYSLNMIFGGKVQLGPENSDITVTNIDAILQPMGQHGNMGLQCDMLSGTMIFDEYHELVGNSPMWSAFLILMAARMEANGRNILVSATPLDIMSCLKVNPDEVLYLPGKNMHYQAQHSVPYHIETADSMPSLVSGDSFAISNSISRVQKVQCGIMFHSKYTDEDKNGIISQLLNSFGKGKTNVVDGVSAGPILSTSLDLSCTHLYESVCSPMDSMQRIGRCNRFGNKSGCSVTFVTGSVPGERDYVDMKFTTELRSEWCDTIRREFNKKDITLDEMYRCYDKFMEENASRIKRWMVGLQQESINCLVTNCAPCVFEVALPKNNKGKSGGTIRNPEPNMYYIVPSADEKTYYGPFSIDIATANGPKYGRIFRQVNNLTEYEKAKLASPALVNGTTEYLSGGTRKKRWYKENADKLARNSESPFVVSARYMTYDSFNGVVFNSNMED
ncbi:MAG: CRISPR-associated endonuclease Cas3'' [Bacteroidaceae bacterium]|nr:CRISPR-associated endonuclease Cas3'' [Bacteroidaceae bacterium]